MTQSFKIITLGCKVNQYESAHIHESLIDAGLKKADKGQKTDISIINTCIVTQTASHQSRQEIRKAVRANPDGVVVATGCYAQAFPTELSEIQGIRMIAGNTAKGTLPQHLLNISALEQKKIIACEFEPGTPFEYLPIKHFSNRSRAFLKIQDGCQSFCSYCIVPLARGPYRSLAPEKVLSAIATLAGEGYQEIVLTGIHLGKYGVDLGEGTTLNGLLASIGKMAWPVRIRLSSLEINEIDMELIEMMASETWLCRHFHIPLQSGDNGVLKKMNRNYTFNSFARLIETIHDKVPLAALGLDVMCGFPGEGPDAHQNTFSLVRDLPVSYVHVFPFSPRPGTAAANYEGRVEPHIIKKRAAQLRTLGHEKKRIFYQSCLKKNFMVIPEGWHSEKDKIKKGKSDNYLPVLFPDSQDTNQPVPVFMERVEDGRLIGTVVS